MSDQQFHVREFDDWVEKLKAENQRLMERTVDLRLDLGKANAKNKQLRGLLERGLDVTRNASVSWQSTYAWKRWIEDVENEVSDG